MKLILKILFFSFLFPSIVLAAPAISNVSGTISSGQSVAIAGSNFLSKSPAAPSMWANFEEGSVDETDLCTGNLSNQIVTITQVKTASNSLYAVRGAPTGSTPFIGVSDSNNPTVYIFVKRYYDDADWWSNCTGGGENFKTLRFWPAPHSGYPNFIIQDAFGQMNYASEMTQGTAKLSDTYPPVQQWNIEEYEADQGTLDTSDASIKVWYNGVDGGDKTFQGKTTDNPTNWGDFLVQGQNSNCDNSNYMYFDDLYIDTTWSRVMIGNASTFSNSTHKEIQIPTAWATGEITVVVNTGSFENGQAWLYVVDSNGDVNSSGFEITIGEAQASTLTTGGTSCGGCKYN